MNKHRNKEVESLDESLSKIGMGGILESENGNAGAQERGERTDYEEDQGKAELSQDTREKVSGHLSKIKSLLDDGSVANTSAKQGRQASSRGSRRGSQRERRSRNRSTSRNLSEQVERSILHNVVDICEELADYADPETRSHMAEIVDIVEDYYESNRQDKKVIEMLVDVTSDAVSRCA